MHTSVRIALPVSLAVTLLLCGCSKPAEVAAPSSPVGATAATPAASVGAKVEATSDHPESGIAWKYATSDKDVDAAFALAKADAKPVFLYWGAKWCPPCNQVKATLFNRQDFIERSRAFVPVYVDGDSPGAQKLGARFQVSGYPTMVLFSSQGVELTRLPGEVEGERYTQVLTLGMNAQRPVKEVLSQALAGAKTSDAAGGSALTANDWRLLAFYSWDTDEQQLVPKTAVPALLKRLADACPADPPEIATRLRLQALAAIDDEHLAKPVVAGAPARSYQATLTRVLADPSAARAQMDVLTNNAPDIVRAVSVKGTPARTETLAAFDKTLKRFEADATLSRADRMTALIAQVELAKIDVPKPDKSTFGQPIAFKLPDVLITDIREQTARADREITDGYERQAVITTAADLLQEAGLSGESDALLKSNLAKSHSPYYLMSALAINAKARGDKAEALHWFEQAFDKSEGPATRLQWGSSYVNALIDMAPDDEARIEKVASSLLTEAQAQPDAFYERSGRALRRVGSKLQGWNKSGAHAATIKRLQAQVDGMCGKLDAADQHRQNCTALLTASSKKSA